MNTKDKGNTTEAMVLAALVRAGREVLVPWGDNLRYDLAYDDDGHFVRVQCKTGRLRNGGVIFATCSSQAHRGRGNRNYKGQADLFGVYCPELDQVFLVPVVDCGVSQCVLRIDATKNNQKTKVRLASEYEINAL